MSLLAPTSSLHGFLQGGCRESPYKCLTWHCLHVLLIVYPYLVCLHAPLDHAEAWNVDETCVFFLLLLLQWLPTHREIPYSVLVWFPIVVLVPLQVHLVSWPCPWRLSWLLPSCETQNGLAARQSGGSHGCAGLGPVGEYWAVEGIVGLWPPPDSKLLEPKWLRKKHVIF